MIAPGSISEALLAASRSPRGIRTIEHDGRALPLSYAELAGNALAIAGALHASGLVPGDRVALVVPEVGDFIRAFFGISAAGLVPVPLCPPAQAGDIPTFARQSRHILEAGRVAAVVTAAAVAPLLDLDGLPLRALLALERLPASRPLDRPVRVALDAPALLQFTSGSTAAPKGVVLTHANLHANIAMIDGPDGLAVGPDDIGVSWLPLYHDMGLIGMLLTAVYAAVDTVVMSPVLFLKRPTAWLEAISTYRGTVSFAPNFAYDLCLRRVKPSQVEALDLSSWRVAGCGAEPIRPDILRAFAERFACAGFRESAFVASYGLAEHSLAVAFARDGLHVDAVDAGRLVHRSIAVPASDGSPAVRLVGCGRAFPGHEVRIVDETGAFVSDRHVGSIVARGPSVMAGYFDDPAATAEVLRDGWLDTGDTGYMVDGELFVCGRAKDLIIRQGRKYHPPDLEAAIADLPGIRPSGVVVFGFSRPGEGDEVVAVLEARASAASGDIVERVRRRVRETAGLELDRVVVTPPGTIPRTTSGKVRRAETRERFQAGTLLAGRTAERQSVSR
ncbi:MAG: fatty acyl-AMP ligase [Betaproteobacteria bacterium]